MKVRFKQPVFKGVLSEDERHIILKGLKLDFGIGETEKSVNVEVYADTENNVFLEFMDMVGQQFDEVWTYTKSLTDLNVRVNKLSEGISKDVAIHYANALGLDLYSGNDIMILPTYLLGKNNDGGDLFESPQEQVTEKIWKRILANLPFFIKSKGTERALKGLLNCYGIPSSMLRARESVSYTHLTLPTIYSV